MDFLKTRDGMAKLGYSALAALMLAEFLTGPEG